MAQYEAPTHNEFDDLTVEKIEAVEFAADPIESLTAGHGIGEMGASTFPSTASCCSA